MTNYIISVDLGQANDFSALSVIRRVWTFPQRKEGEAYDPRYSELRHEIPLLVEWPLETPYPEIEERIETIYRTVYEEPDADRVALIVDRGGPGRPVIDHLRKRELHPIGITVTGGDFVGERGDDFTVPKKDIVSSLIFEAQSGRIKIDKLLELAARLQEQIDGFGYKINRNTGNTSYESLQEKIHDDLVVTVAAGLWYSRTKLPQRLTGAVEKDTDDYALYNPLKREARVQS
jgi:hypothetical protein